MQAKTPALKVRLSARRIFRWALIVFLRHDSLESVGGVHMRLRMVFTAVASTLVLLLLMLVLFSNLASHSGSERHRPSSLNNLKQEPIAPQWSWGWLKREPSDLERLGKVCLRYASESKGN